MREVRLEDRLAGFGAYSYRDDAGVPAFDDSRPLVVFDGVCVLCSGFARYVLRNDTGGRFLLTATQMSLGAALMRHYGLDPDNPATNLLIWHGRAHGKLDGVTRIMGLLGRWRRACRIAGLMPRRLADWIYDRIATNRYHLFGRTAQCMVPAPEWKDRIIG